MKMKKSPASLHATDFFRSTVSASLRQSLPGLAAGSKTPLRVHGNSVLFLGEQKPLGLLPSSNLPAMGRLDIVGNGLVLVIVDHVTAPEHWCALLLCLELIQFRVLGLGLGKRLTPGAIGPAGSGTHADARGSRGSLPLDTPLVVRVKLAVLAAAAAAAEG